ncbi:signal peptide peptidase SppA [Sporosarcina gallistercoris]|uniref:Signal peptide peptidase SppA n=1 Tax=Sporosarcina gallistercoris TaxID=2762245 RepID=A0ABR8PID4_9BACL|nr:signal peptide peptidase SppA [Sporosarcina gallistercoris]MBD7907924.1 signal peptide peptidase SppA [Sporosarcina gallistercoris]
MSTKRWIALISAAALVVVSIGVNSLSYIFTRDFNALFEDSFAMGGPTYEETVLEQGDSNERIAVLNVSGVIQDTGPASPFAAPGYNHQNLLSQLADIREDQSVKGIVLHVDSPGGGVVESSDIYDELISIQENRDIPIYVSMGSMAASGGYYIAAPADKIFVHPETITGSIGVIMESLNYAELADKVGIDFNTIKTGPYKDIMSPNREMTQTERDMLQEMINDSYERFVGIVADGRGMSVANVKKVADGRIMNGRQAIESGLADDYGKLPDVIDALITEQGFKNPTVFEYSSSDSLSSIFGTSVSGLFKKNAETELIQKLLTDYQAPRMMYLYGER